MPYNTHASHDVLARTQPSVQRGVYFYSLLEWNIFRFNAESFPILQYFCLEGKKTWKYVQFIQGTGHFKYSQLLDERLREMLGFAEETKVRSLSPDLGSSSHPVPFQPVYFGVLLSAAR